MDFEYAKPIIDALHKRIDHKVFGYSPGVIPAIAALANILTDKGDKVII
jgi:bifunctional pyridoxal-dependent enzyme with beta-cystathionase and maltose regulon repressor activities